jgi:hypothetical protein
MRKISQDAYNAFINNRNFKSSNTIVLVEENKTSMYLHKNEIAKIEYGELFISDGGHGTSTTTRDRLNAFPEVWLSFRKGQWFVDKTVKWDGKWANVNLFKEG